MSDASVGVEAESIDGHHFVPTVKDSSFYQLQHDMTQTPSLEEFNSIFAPDDLETEHTKSKRSREGISSNKKHFRPPFVQSNMQRSKALDDEPSEWRLQPIRSMDLLEINQDSSDNSCRNQTLPSITRPCVDQSTESPY